MCGYDYHILNLGNVGKENVEKKMSFTHTFIRSMAWGAWNQSDKSCRFHAEVHYNAFVERVKKTHFYCLSPSYCRPPAPGGLNDVSLNLFNRDKKKNSTLLDF
jgi:hypothetical protein